MNLSWRRPLRTASYKYVMQRPARPQNRKHVLYGYWCNGVGTSSRDNHRLSRTHDPAAPLSHLRLRAASGHRCIHITQSSQAKKKLEIILNKVEYTGKCRSHSDTYGVRPLCALHTALRQGLAGRRRRRSRCRWRHGRVPRQAAAWRSCRAIWRCGSSSGRCARRQAPGWPGASEISALGGASERLHGCTTQPKRPQLCSKAQRAARAQAGGRPEPQVASSAATRRRVWSCCRTSHSPSEPMMSALSSGVSCSSSTCSGCGRGEGGAGAGRGRGDGWDERPRPRAESGSAGRGCTGARASTAPRAQASS